jgi:predicted molibdopterin-dependent oxidoreductase YjgC
MLTARIGQPQSGIYPLYRHINAQGALDVGMTPSHYPGHLSASQVNDSDRFTKVWGNQLPERAGLNYRDILAAAHRKQIKGLYLMGEDPLSFEPEREKVLEALKQVEFLVVQDLALTQCGQLADVVLPSTAFTEQEGTLTNIERRIQKLRSALPAPGKALPDWQIVAALLAKLQAEASYQDAESVYEEITSVVPFYEGLTYARLEEGGLQWPHNRENPSGLLKLEDLNKPLRFAISD